MRLECPSGTPGFRVYGSGMLWYVGNSGYSWSSSMAGTSAHYLSFYYGGIGPQHGNGRAYGFPLRCLREREEDENRRV